MGGGGVRSSCGSDKSHKRVSSGLFLGTVLVCSFVPSVLLVKERKCPITLILHYTTSYINSTAPGVIAICPKLNSFGPRDSRPKRLK